MTHKYIKSFFVAIIMAVFCLVAPMGQEDVYAKTNISNYNFIVLSRYSKTLSIGQEWTLIAVTSNGKIPTFKSSSSSIASVNSYGLVTAKKAGSCKITVKCSGAEAICKVTVKPTEVKLNYEKATLEIGGTLQLTAKSSTNHDVKWKSSKTSVVSVNKDGLLTAKKAGEATITATVDGTSKTCKVTVKEPRIVLDVYHKTIYRTHKFKLGVYVSSGRKPTFKSNSTKVATVDNKGNITGMKHGQALITVTVDGVSAACIVTVAQPTITLSSSEKTLKVGQETKLIAKVSSGVKPKWSSSNINIVSVDSNGYIRARQPGKAYIYATEDGVRASCIVYVY